MKPQNDKTQVFLKYIDDLIDDGLKCYIAALRSQNSSRAPQINIYITIKILYMLFKIDDQYVESYLGKIQEVAEIFIMIFKQKNIRGKSMEEYEDLIGKFTSNVSILGNIDESFNDENFESQKYLYVNMREFLIILLRILATKFSSI